MARGHPIQQKNILSSVLDLRKRVVVGGIGSGVVGVIWWLGRGVVEEEKQVGRWQQMQQQQKQRR